MLCHSKMYLIKTSKVFYFSEHFDLIEIIIFSRPFPPIIFRHSFRFFLSFFVNHKFQFPNIISLHPNEKDDENFSFINFSLFFENEFMHAINCTFSLTFSLSTPQIENFCAESFLRYFLYSSFLDNFRPILLHLFTPSLQIIFDPHITK